jgi:hypothetical protein
MLIIQRTHEFSFTFTQVFTVFTFHYFSLDQKNPNSKKQKAFTIFANKIFTHFLIGGAFSKNSRITNKRVIKETRDDLLK